MQIQLQYNLYEDRLMLVVTNEADNHAWWISRRAARMLVTVFREHLLGAFGEDVDEEAKEWMLAMRQEEAQRDISIESLPSLPVDCSHLLVSLRHGLQDDGAHILIFVGMDKKEQVFNLDTEGLFSIAELFRQQLYVADWGISLDMSEKRRQIADIISEIQ